MCKDGMTGECEGDENKCWYKYDDEQVKLIDDIETQMLSTSKAYILFYQKVELSSQPSNMPGGLMVTPQKAGPPAAALKGGAKPFDLEGKGALRVNKS